MDDPMSALNILIIDDQRAMRSILRQLLESIGIRNVRDAPNGDEALAMLTEYGEPCDLILCDLFMDKMDGLQFCNAIRRDADLRNRHIPVLLLTAERDKLVLDVVRQVGATAIAHKPISAPELRAAIERLVGFSGKASRSSVA
jgi:two-component system, chemotaxis family, chemotaxis protein CheY